MSMDDSVYEAPTWSRMVIRKHELCFADKLVQLYEMH